MATTTPLTEGDVEHLWAVMIQLSQAGRPDEATAVAKAYYLACTALYPQLAIDPDGDPGLEASLQEADLEIAAGGTASHDEVMRRLEARTDA